MTCPKCRKPMTDKDKATYGRCEDCYVGETPAVNKDKRGKLPARPRGKPKEKLS